MKTKSLLFAITMALFVFAGCKNETPKEVKKENLTLAISGMTCEIGCAKTIQSKLSKKEGVLGAKVVFKDSIANIEFDANTTSKKELIAFVDGIAGGDLYKASIAKKEPHTCTDACKKDCENKIASKKECKENCKMACCVDKKS